MKNKAFTMLFAAAFACLYAGVALAMTFSDEASDAAPSSSGSTFPWLLLLILLCFGGGIAFVVHLIIRAAKSGGKGLADFAAFGWIGKEGVGMLRNRAKRSAPDSSERSGSEKSDMRECPHCAEVIKRRAKICRFCNREID